MARRLALITGGTSGIGLGVAEKLAPDFDLALAYAANSDRALAVLSNLKSKFPECRIEVFSQKLVDLKTCENLYTDVLKTFNQKPSVLVNSAGRLQDDLLLNADFEEYKKIIDEHLIATMALTQLSLKSMYKEKFGRVVNLSSISANFAKRGQSSYAAAKAGIEAFTRTVALEVAHRGVTVNAVAPGLIESPMTEKMIQDMESSDYNLRKRIPAGRAGKPEEVGALVAFLCSESAAYITGSVLTIDGGRSLGDSLS